jgi:phosphatidylglycerophosphate synthase
MGSTPRKISMSNSTYVPERRPLASREKAASKRVAAWLARLGVRPNSISVASMIAGILAGGAFAATAHLEPHWLFFLLAAGLIQLRLLANMLDGMVAVATQQASPVGELFNEVPDRVSDAAILIGAGYASGATAELGYLAACVALFVAYVRAEGKVAGAPQEFCGPMAKPQRMFVLTVAALVCAVVPHAWRSVPDHPHLAIMNAALALIVVGGLWTAVRRLSRIAKNLRRAGA